MAESSNKEITFPFLPILALIFITLKLTGHITWSWWWVLSPILIPVILIVFGFGIFFLLLPFITKDKK